MSDLFDPRLIRYLEDLVPARPPELRRMEEIARATNFPIVGPACGHLCYLIARLIGARRVFELGSGYGYSTAWFARAVRENGGGEVHHVVWDEKLSARARDHLTLLGYSDLVRYTVDEAVQALDSAEGPFDLIFNDIEKKDYPGALEVVSRKLRPGGVLIADNALWSGRVFDPSEDDAATTGVRDFTRRLAADPAWITSIAPIRDGLLVAWRVG